MDKAKDVLTTGQVAKICNVAPRTVSKWFDTGQLRGYRIPGSKDRRIPVAQLIRFMKAHGIPLNGLDGGLVKVLIIDKNPELARTLAQQMQNDGRYEAQIAEGGFDAGLIAEQFRPQIILVDIMIEDIDIKKVSAIIRQNPELQDTRIIAVTGHLTEGEIQALLQQGFDNCIERPLEITKIVDCIDETLSVMH